MSRMIARLQELGFPALPKFWVTDQPNTVFWHQRADTGAVFLVLSKWGEQIESASDDIRPSAIDRRIYNTLLCFEQADVPEAAAALFQHYKTATARLSRLQTRAKSRSAEASSAPYRQWYARWRTAMQERAYNPRVPLWSEEKQRRCSVDWAGLVPECIAKSQVSWERCATAASMNRSGISLKEIGLKFGLSGQRIAQMIAKAGRQPRSPIEIYYTASNAPEEASDLWKLAPFCVGRSRDWIYV